MKGMMFKLMKMMMHEKLSAAGGGQGTLPQLGAVELGAGNAGAKVVVHDPLANMAHTKDLMRLATGGYLDGAPDED